MNPDPGGQFPQLRVIEYVVEGLVILVVLFLVWCALAANGFAPLPPIIFSGMTESQRQDRALIVVFVAVIAVLLLPAMRLLEPLALKPKVDRPALSPLGWRTYFLLTVLMNVVILYSILHQPEEL